MTGAECDVLVQRVYVYTGRLLKPRGRPSLRGEKHLRSDAPFVFRVPILTCVDGLNVTDRPGEAVCRRIGTRNPMECKCP